MTADSFLERFPGEAGGVLVEKGQRKEGDGERSCVGLLLGLCLGLMACSIRPLPSFSMCFWGGSRRDVSESGGNGHCSQPVQRFELLCLNSSHDIGAETLHSAIVPSDTASAFTMTHFQAPLA